MSYRLGVIGGGNMGQAIVRGAIRSNALQARDIIIAEIDHAKLEALRSLGCEATADPRRAAEAENILLAVKPQSFADVARTIGPLRSSGIVISIMAGLDTKKIRNAMGPNARVVRAMPNMPAQIGAGMSAIALGDGARPGDESMALDLFSAVGKTVMLDESLMHAVTAVSGSGPAYVFAMAEAMMAAGTAIGLEREIARTLVQQTILGAAKMMDETGQPAAALRQAVTSPGGTTAAALEVFGRRAFDELIVEALTVARDRGVKLSQG